MDVRYALLYHRSIQFVINRPNTIKTNNGYVGVCKAPNSVAKGSK